MLLIIVLAITIAFIINLAFIWYSQRHPHGLQNSQPTKGSDQNSNSSAADTTATVPAQEEEKKWKATEKKILESNAKTANTFQPFDKERKNLVLHGTDTVSATPLCLNKQEKKEMVDEQMLEQVESASYSGVLSAAENDKKLQESVSSSAPLEKTVEEVEAEVAVPTSRIYFEKMAEETSGEKLGEGCHTMEYTSNELQGESQGSTIEQFVCNTTSAAAFSDAKHLSYVETTENCFDATEDGFQEANVPATVPAFTSTATAQENAEKKEKTEESNKEREQAELQQQVEQHEQPITHSQDSKISEIAEAAIGESAAQDGIWKDLFSETARREKDLEQALDCKELGNVAFKEKDLEKAIYLYSEAITICPGNFKENKAVLYCNRAACYQHMSQWDSVVADCTAAIENNGSYVKAYVRRLAAYEALKKWHDALRDMEKVIELDTAARARYEHRHKTLKRLSEEQLEREKAEMIDKLKGFGNLVLGKFGMSVDNFKVNQNESGSYNIQFVPDANKSNR